MVSESDGPDKLKNGYGCYAHHSGVRNFSPSNIGNIDSGRAMITDYDCCCDPCAYSKASDYIMLSHELTGSSGNFTGETTDGFVNEVGNGESHFNNTSTTIIVGDNDSEDFNSWVVFDTSLPENTSFTSAVLSLVSVNEDFDTVEFVVRGQDVASADPYANRVEYDDVSTGYGTRVTSAQNTKSLSSVTVDEKVNIDVTAIMTELSQKSGWDGTVLFEIANSGSNPDHEYYFGSANHGTSSSRPSLSVTYTSDEANVPQGHHCCKCNPNLIVAKWTGDIPGDSCAPPPQQTPLFLQYAVDGTNTLGGADTWAEYAGSLNNRPIKVTLSNFDLNPTGGITLPGDGSGCRWTLFVSDSSGTWNNYSKSVAFVDHINTTCLGVPNVSFSGVSGFESSGGTVNLYDYETVKVPFQRRAELFDHPQILKVEGEYESVQGTQYYGDVVHDPVISVSTAFPFPSTGVLTIDQPSGVESLDLLVASVGTYDNVTITPPAGWSEITNQLGDAGRLATYSKIASSGDPSSFSWSLSGNTKVNGSIYRISGHDTSPIEDSISVTGVSTTGVTPSIHITERSVSLQYMISRRSDSDVVITGENFDIEFSGVNDLYHGGTSKVYAGGNTESTSWDFGSEKNYVTANIGLEMRDLLPSGDMTVVIPNKKISPPKIDNGWDAPFVNPTGGDWINGLNPTGVVPLNTLCTEVPRYLCVTEYDTGQGTANRVYREFIYDTGFFPTERAEFHPSHTGIESFATGVVLAKWDYTPLGGDNNVLPANELAKSIYLYETYVEAIADYNGDAAAAMASGSPKYIFCPAFEGNPYPIGKDDHVMIGAAYYSHPAIHYQDYDQLSDIQLRTENENFYWVPSGSLPGQNRSLFLGGLNDYVSNISYGDGNQCPCNPTAYGTTYDGVSATTDYYCNIKTGRCSCWEYLCSDKCRCLPKYFCYVSYEVDMTAETVTQGGGQVEWDEEDKCWHANKGQSDQVSLCITKATNGYVAGNAGESYNGACQIGPAGGMVSDGFEFDSLNAASCDPVDMQFSFSSTTTDGSGNALTGYQIYFAPSFADCSSRSFCTDATICAENCGSHPGSIVVELSGYSVIGEDECLPDTPAGIDCSGTIEASVNMSYYENYTLIEGDGGTLNLEVECGYRGFLPCGGGQKEILWHGGSGSPNPGLTIVEPGGQSTNYALTDEYWDGSIDQSCDPYEVVAVYNNRAPFTPEWACSDTSVHRFTLTITE